MSDDKDSDKRDQINRNVEKVSDVIEVLKLGKLISQKNMDNDDE